MTTQRQISNTIGTCKTRLKQLYSNDCHGHTKNDADYIYAAATDLLGAISGILAKRLK